MSIQSDFQNEHNSFTKNPRNDDYDSIEDFEQKNDVQLPEDITAMLQRQ